MAARGISRSNIANRPRVQAPLPGPRARQLVDRDHQLLSPSYSRPYPLVVAEAEGVWVTDVDGNRFLDFTSGIAVTNTGHRHPRIVEAIRRQIDLFLHMSGTDFYYPQEVALAERLVAISPTGPGSKVFFTNSGTESVEGAMKLARYATGRPMFLAFHGAFHGRTMGALSLSASKAVHRLGFGPFLPGVVHVPFPDPYRPAFADPSGQAVVGYIEETVLHAVAPPSQVAAVVVEPILGEGGYVVPPDDFLPALREMTRRHNILLVLDEVQTGFGRTGRMFACEHWGVEPDIVCLAKGIASGLPLGAFIARAGLMDWPQGAHGNTFGGNPVACAAALATLDVLQEEGLVDQAASVGDLLLQGLRQLQGRHPRVGDVRGRGLMIGVEMVRDPATRKPAPELAARVVQEAFQRGLLLLTAGTSAIRLSPPLVLTEEEAMVGLEVLEEALAAAGA